MARFCLWIAAGTLVFVIPATAQPDRDVWVAASNGSVYRVSRDGVVLGQYASGCAAGISPCNFSLARDGAGNVYVARYTLWAPGITGSIGVFRAPLGEVGAASGPSTAVVTDLAGAVWSVSPVLPAGAVVSTQFHLNRWSSGFTGVLAQALLNGTGPGLVPHPVSGVWVTQGAVVSRAGPNAAVLASVQLPGTITSSAADGRGRLWAFESATGTLHRVVESPAGALAIDWSWPVGAAESVHVDGCDVVRVHVPAAGASTVLRFTPEGQPLPAETFGVRFSTIDVGTDGSLWAQYADLPNGANLIHVGASGTTVTYLGPYAAAPFQPGGLRALGDTTGAAFAHLAAPLSDSDGDGAANGRESVLGADPFDPLRAPPALAIAAAPGSPSTWNLVYADSDPAHAGLVLQLACAFGSSGGIALGPLGTCPVIPLDPDALFALSLGAGPPVFTGFNGILGPSGTASATVQVPPGTPPGIPIHFSGVTWSPALGAVVAIADTAIRPTP